MQREIGQKWTALPTGAVDQPQARQAPRHIASRSNPVYRELKALALDKRVRRESGQTLLDGRHLMQVAHAAGARFSRIVAAPAAADELASWLDVCPGAEGVIVEAELIRSLAPTQTPTGIMAVVTVPPPRERVPQFIVLLEAIQDPGNLGALIRCAAAAGAEAVHLSPGCSEAWSPKALRGGQGAQFLVDIHEQADLVAVAREFRGPCHAAVLGAAPSLYALDLTGPCAFAFGNEGAGLGEALLQVCRPFTIPMPGGTESLNVAAAAAVCLFERVRQQAAQTG
jgi:TrmH family RNA methyltransferase